MYLLMKKPTVNHRTDVAADNSTVSHHTDSPMNQFIFIIFMMGLTLFVVCLTYFVFAPRWLSRAIVKAYTHKT